MLLLAKVLATYMVVSFTAGLALMLVDAFTGFQHARLLTAVTALYLPPVGLLLLGIVAASLSMLWGGF